MSEQPKVVIFEDSEVWQEMVRDAVESWGGAVVAIVDNMATALDEVIPQLAVWGVTHVFVDGRLSEDGVADGKIITSAVKAVKASITTIGLSGGKQDYVDVEIGKLDYHQSEHKLKKALGLE